jgi:hypothetical protein
LAPEGTSILAHYRGRRMPDDRSHVFVLQVL